MVNTTANDGGHSSSAWGEAAAAQLLHLKHQRPSRTECHAASELLGVILQSTDDYSTPSASCRRPALVGACDDAASRPTIFQTRPIEDGVVNVAGLPSPIPVADSRDDQYLSPLQCYVRKYCVEYFAATASNVATKGRQTPVSEGRIGVRCAFCKHLHRDHQAAQATSFPNKLASIYSSVVMLQCRHFPRCEEMPDNVRQHLFTLKKAGSSVFNSSGNKRQGYWVDRASDMGFVDTDGGIRFVPHAVGASFKTNVVSECKTLDNHFLPSTNEIVDKAKPRLHVVSPFEPILSSPVSIDYEFLIKGSDLVTLKDRDLVPDYIFLALAQLQPCKLTADDRIGVYRERKINSRGLFCRHCQGCQPGPGYGKYFPNSLRSLAQTTTTQTIVKHITRKCKHVPNDIKYAISYLQQEATEDSKPAYAPKCSSDDRPKYGSRKEFFQRIWGRLHGIDLAQSSDRPPVMLATPSQVFSFPESKVFRPTPIRRVVPVPSNDVPLRLKNNDNFGRVSSGDESPCLNVDLFDDKNRRVVLRIGGEFSSGGNSFSSNEGKKRCSAGAFTDVAVSKKKLKISP